jgi:hypothetical protein
MRQISQPDEATVARENSRHPERPPGEQFAPTVHRFATGFKRKPTTNERIQATQTILAIDPAGAADLSPGGISWWRAPLLSGVQSRRSGEFWKAVDAKGAPGAWNAAVDPWPGSPRDFGAFHGAEP